MVAATLVSLRMLGYICGLGSGQKQLSYALVSPSDKFKGIKIEKESKREYKRYKESKHERCCYRMAATATK